MADRVVLLTGASGLLGTWLLRSAPPDVDVVGLVHRRRLPTRSTVTADLREPLQVRAALRDARPSLVIHAAYAKDRASIVEATRHVVDAASDVGADVLHVSTDTVFRGDGVDRDEGAVPDPTFDYGRWKADAEHIVTARSTSNALVRPSLIVSVDPDDHAVEQIRTAAARGGTTAWFSDELRQPAHARDLADALWRIAALEPDRRAGAWHLPGPETLSRYDIATRVVDVLGLDPDSVVPERRPPDSDRPRHLHLRDDRARRDIGWSPSPIFR